MTGRGLSAQPATGPFQGFKGTAADPEMDAPKMGEGTTPQ